MLIVYTLFQIGLISSYIVTIEITKEWLSKRVSSQKIQKFTNFYALFYFTLAYILLLAIKEVTVTTTETELIFNNIFLLVMIMFLMVIYAQGLYLSGGITIEIILLLNLLFIAKGSMKLVVFFLISMPLMLVLVYFNRNKKRIIKWFILELYGLVFWTIFLMTGDCSQNLMLTLMLDYFILSSFIFLIFHLDKIYQEIAIKNKHDLLVDQMTSARNYRAFIDDINQGIKLHAVNGISLSFIMVDIDYFKAINDKYGHLIGNEILRTVTNELLENAETLVPKANVYRLGGEEFGILLQQKTMEETSDFAYQCHDSVGQIQITQEPDIKITISLGYAMLQLGETDKQFYQRVDKFLYQAKENGRNRVVGPIDNI